MIEAHIDYIMSCSDDEFEHITGVRLPEDAWDRWKADMHNRTEQLHYLFKRTQEYPDWMRQKLANSLEDLNKWSDLVRKGEAEVTSVSFKRVEK